jgi:hypothetical protein
MKINREAEEQEMVKQFYQDVVNEAEVG